MLWTQLSFAASPQTAGEYASCLSGSPGDTLHLYLTDDSEVFFHWNARLDEIGVVSTDAKELRATLEGLLKNSPKAAATLHASLKADPGLVHQVTETARVSGASSVGVVVLENTEKEMLATRLPGYALEKRRAPAIDGYTLTVLVYRTPHFIYYLNEEYPNVQVAKFDTAEVKQLLRPFADAKIAVKIHDKASITLVKQLFSVFNELGVTDFAFFKWTPEEEVIARQRTETHSSQIKK